MIVISTIIVGAGALSMKKLKSTPSKEQEEDISKATSTIISNLSVNKSAVAPGAISIAITRIIPTAFKAPTIVSDSSDRSP